MWRGLGIVLLIVIAAWAAEEKNTDTLTLADAEMEASVLVDALTAELRYHRYQAMVQAETARLRAESEQKSAAYNTLVAKLRSKYNKTPDCFPQKGKWQCEQKANQAKEQPKETKK